MLSARSWFLRADRALDRAFASDVRAPVKASRSDTHGPTVRASTHSSCGSSTLIVISSTSSRSSSTLNVPTSPSISSGRAEESHWASTRQWCPSKLHDAQGAFGSSSPSISVTPSGAVHFSPRTLDLPTQSCAIFSSSGTAMLRRASVTHKAALTALASASLLRSISLSCADRRFGRSDADRTHLRMSQVRMAVTATSNTDWVMAGNLPAQENGTTLRKKPRAFLRSLPDGSSARLDGALPSSFDAAALSYTSLFGSNTVPHT